MCKVTGAVLAMVSLVEFVWYATTFSSERVMNEMVLSEDTASQPMPADLMASLIQMMTFVSVAVLMSMFLDSTGFSESKCLKHVKK